MRFSEGLEVLGTNEYQKDGAPLDGVFENSAVEHVELPSTLKRLECGVFAFCKNLKSLILPEGIEYIGPICFSRSAIKWIRLPPVVQTIEESTFFQCENLKSVQLPEKL